MESRARHRATPAYALAFALGGCSDTGLNVVRQDPPAAEPTRLLEVQPEAVEVDGLDPMEAWQGVLVWTSIGEASVTVDSMALEGTGWTVDATQVPVELAPGSSLVATLAFTSAVAGEWPGTVTLQADTDAGASMTVPLRALVLEPTGTTDTSDSGVTVDTADDTGSSEVVECGSYSPFELSLVDRIDVPGTAQIALDTVHRRLFAPYEYGANSVGVYDLDTLVQIEVLPAESMPNPALVEDVGGHVLVGNKLSESIGVYDSTTLATLDRLTVVDPQHMIVDEDLGLIYVASMSAGQVIALDAVSLEEAARLTLEPYLRQGSYADGIVVFPSTSGLLHVIDAASFRETASIDLGEQLFGSAWLPEADRIYASGWDTGTVYVLEASTMHVVTTLPMGAPYQMAVDHDRCLVAVAGYGDDHLRIVDAANDSVVADIAVCSAPMDVAFDASTHRWFVACYGSDDIAVVEEY